MKLRFHPKCGAGEHPPPLVHWPGLKANGQMIRYVGRRLNKKTRVYEAEKDVVEVDSASEAGRAFTERCRREYSLWPADAETAAHCGRPFVELVRESDGEFRPEDRTIHPATGEPKKNRKGEVFERQDDGTWKLRGEQSRSQSKQKSGGAEL